MLDLFKLRGVWTSSPRSGVSGNACIRDEEVSGAGSEGCTDERYAEEAVAVHGFATPREQSMVTRCVRSATTPRADGVRAGGGDPHRLAKAEAVAAEVAEVVRALAIWMA